MAPTDSFAALLGRLRSDEDAAARDVVRRYSRQLIALTRRQFEPGLAHRVDPEDVVQSALKSFFLRSRAGALQAGNWATLWGLLALITRRKCVDRVEYLRAGRRDVGREASAAEGGDPPWQLAADRTAAPPEAAVIAETVERLSRAVEADDRPILELSLQGYTAAEIGLRLGRAVRSVHRVRERIRKRLVRLQAEG
jgi:RNA polymerase sigma-70 factor (ECF subfamily)